VKIGKNEPKWHFLDVNVKKTFLIIVFKHILNPYVLLLNFYYKHLKIIESIIIGRKYG